MIRHLQTTCFLLAAALASPVHDALPQTREAPAPVLRDLDGTSALRARFDGDRGKIRIVLLLSPT